MKYSAGIVAALASCAYAAQPAGKAYVFPQPDSSSTTAMTRSLARLVFLDRLAAPGQGPSIKDIPSDVEIDEAVSTLNRFGESSERLFSYTSPDDVPNRLLVLLEGMTQQQIDDAGSALGSEAAFTITDPPSATANEMFFAVDVYNAGVKGDHKCSLSKIMQLADDKCWTGKAAAFKYNANKNADAFNDILKELKTLESLGDIGRVVSTVVLLPQSDANSKPQDWLDKPQELRRRQAEQVISAPEEAAESKATTSPAPTSTAPSHHKGPIPACFNSAESCMEATDSCSGRGNCTNKYGEAPADPKEGDVCYVCRCIGTASESGDVKHWGGPTCGKQDVSVPFWLFVSSGVLLAGIVYFAIGLLYSIGEEQLPGVIGAGVSRSK